MAFDIVAFAIAVAIVAAILLVIRFLLKAAVTILKLVIIAAIGVGAYFLFDAFI